MLNIRLLSNCVLGISYDIYSVSLYSQCFCPCLGRPNQGSMSAHLVSPYQIIPIRLGAVDSAPQPAEGVVLLSGVTNSVSPDPP